MNFIFLFLLLAISSSQNSIPHKIERSIFFFNENDHKTSLMVSFQKNEQIEKYFSGNIWLSENLAINSSLSSSTKNYDINLYYNTSITYRPSNFKFKYFSGNLNLGMHTIRFYNYRSFKWYDFSFLLNSMLDNHKFYLAWNYYTHVKNKHIFHLAYKRLIYQNINILIGSKIYNESNIVIQPFLKLMLNL